MAVAGLSLLALLLSDTSLWSAGPGTTSAQAPYNQCSQQDRNTIWSEVPGCDPRPTLVPLLPPADPNILQVIPSQVLVDRCAGTCHVAGSALYHHCVASETANTTVNVLYERIVFLGGGTSSVEEVCGQVEVETHSGCLCGCDVVNCTAGQVFNQRTCSCRCRDMVLRGQCLVQYNKVSMGQPPRKY